MVCEWWGKVVFILWLVSGLTVLLFCASSTQAFSMQCSGIASIPQSKLDLLSREKIFFGHQSVGYNIIDGLKLLMQENPQIKLRIVDGYAAEDFSQAGLIHSKIGENTKPLTKIKEFSDVILEKSKAGAKIDIAFMKFCYVDVTAETNIDALFNAYKNMVTELEHKFPGLTIIHFTVPLCVTEKTWKTHLKLLLGKEPWELADNARRNEYNNLLRKEYGDSGCLFDLALFESTKPDGSSQNYSYKEMVFSSMYPGYSSDGGHLNDKGSKLVAENLLCFLAALNCR